MTNASSNVVKLGLPSPDLNRGAGAAAAATLDTLLELYVTECQTLGIEPSVAATALATRATQLLSTRPPTPDEIVARVDLDQRCPELPPRLVQLMLMENC
ncbi:MAG: hypothetical protein AAF515_05195 [Pseudomonadota bacterium]